MGDEGPIPNFGPSIQILTAKILKNARAMCKISLFLKKWTKFYFTAALSDRHQTCSNVRCSLIGVMRTLSGPLELPSL